MRIEQERVRRFIEGQIQAYPNRKNIGPGEPGNPISQITLGFYAAQGGNVWLVFDTRVDSEPDGEWTLYLRDSNELCVPEWDGFYSAAFEDESVTIITHDGREVVITEETVSEDLLNELFGEMLADLLRQLRAEGVFSELPLQPGATFDASELCGFYCWPGSDLPRETGLVSR
ncbi:hypothetical protein [Planctomicrobium piriforme]|uniref:hypothetical protein n=1 Tax=Planctomicrobium piriforme TaxID=1576369 RepID=UPI001113DF7D|nr:hypothetical protein [Planctomicrobium piriforme]